MLKTIKIIYMIVIELSKKGNCRWVTQHTSANIWDIEPMVIPRCARCFGVFIFWKSIVNRNVIHSVTGIHLPPGSPSFTKSVSKELLNRIRDDVPKGQPYHIIFGGGKIDTPQNRFLYSTSIKKYIFALKNMFPFVPIEFYKPKENTWFTTMVLKKEGEISTTQYYPKN
ncbi:hypothetical protein IT402_02165 [Candidatus Nomurabacteria bacterium]|nr:hypothetical protein [Candidatus Nomurabacteria bacterium]